MCASVILKNFYLCPVQYRYNSNWKHIEMCSYANHAYVKKFIFQNWMPIMTCHFFLSWKGNFKLTNMKGRWCKLTDDVLLVYRSWTISRIDSVSKRIGITIHHYHKMQRPCRKNALNGVSLSNGKQENRLSVPEIV